MVDMDGRSKDGTEYGWDDGPDDGVCVMVWDDGIGGIESEE